MVSKKLNVKKLINSLLLVCFSIILLFCALNITKALADASKIVLNDANISFRKFMHSSVYFVLALLVCNFINTFEIKRKNLKYIWTIIFVFLYACTDEYHQTFIYRTNS